MKTSHLSKSDVSDKVQLACRRIAPLWPLQNFVAVNPFMGLSDLPFFEAHRMLKRVSGTGLSMSRPYYYDQMAKGRITRKDLKDALKELGSSWDIAEFEQVLFKSPTLSEVSVKLVTDILSEKSPSKDYSGFVTERISRYCAAYFDQGQALWPFPWKDDSLYNGWREFMRWDKTPKVMGLGNLNQVVLTFPENPLDIIALALHELPIPMEMMDDYLYAALLNVGGWAGWTQYRNWQERLQGRQDDSTQHLLAIRLAWELALYRLFGDEALKETWHNTWTALSQPLNSHVQYEIDSVLQTAFEIGYQKELITDITKTKDRAPHNATPDVQAVFCIDVRSEVYRRALEMVAPQIQTKGFAGFFGVLMEYLPLGSLEANRHHPILFNPSYHVKESIGDTLKAKVDKVIRRRHIHLRTIKAWKIFKTSASSCFAFVEAAGILTAPKLISDSIGLTRPVPSPQKAGLQAKVRRNLAPALSPHQTSSSPELTGIAEKERPAAAEFVLRNMGLTQDFSRLIVFVGHASTTVNNPQATALDCGACGGRSGEASAKVAQALLNDPATRQGLKHKGIVIPPDTLFMAALHDTTTDEVELFNAHDVPSSHKEDVAHFRQWTQSATEIARLERATSLGVDDLDERAIHKSIKHRTQDWAQVRPEWALAGNAAFIAAPRHRTNHGNFAGRVFLHDYNWHRDKDFSTLELIMTAPLIVAQWINMQYYGSVVDNRRFGSGNKVLHNVVGGAIGVLEGNGGDLRVGLAMQSLNNGHEWMHEPLRLSVVIEAPQEAIEIVMAHHQEVRDLVDNHWMHLFQLDEKNHISLRRQDKKWHIFPYAMP